jgi:hypothetical protein
MSVTDYLIISSSIERLGLPATTRVFFNFLKLLFILCDDNRS